MKTNYFSNCETLEQVKKLYKKLALRYHPDRPGGSVIIMQRINQEYESFMKDPSSNSTSKMKPSKKTM